MSKVQSGEDQQNARIRENMRGVNLNEISFEEFEEMFEDRDPFEFL